MRRVRLLMVGLVLLVAACSQAEPAASSSSSSVATTTSAPTTTIATTATTATLTPNPAESTSTTSSTTTTAALGDCPELFRDDGPDSEISDVVLAAWNQGTGEKLWEIPLGTRLPSWGVWSDEVVLGFPDGHLVGVDATTCDSWSITVVGGIDDLAVTEVGTYITHSGAELAGFSGEGRGSWRYKAADTVFEYVTDNAGVSVFIDHFGDLIGLESSSGATVFNWENSAGLAVHIAAGESFLYRAAASQLTARPIGGGGVLWNVPVGEIDGLWAVPGTLLAHDGETLTAYEPATGEIRWGVPFDGEIAGPIVLDHNELHIAARHGLLTHDLWHLESATGSIVARGQAPDGREWFVETDDGLMLEVGDDGVVRGITMLQRPSFEINTGANRVSRFTQVEVARGAVIVTLSFAAERF